MVLLRILFLLLPISLFSQIGYNPVSQKQWFKDTLLVSKPMIIPSAAGTGKVLTSDAYGRITLQSPVVTDTTSLSARINTKLTASDTASLSNRLNWELVSTATADTSATIDFTGLTSGYDYVVRYRDLVPSANASIYVRVGTGGTPTYQTGASDYGYARQYNQVTGAGNDPSATAAQIVMAFAVTDNNKNSCGEIEIFNPAGTTLLKAIKYHCSYISTFGATYDASNINGSGFYRGATTAVTAIRIYLSTGTINSGTFTLYKIKISSFWCVILFIRIRRRSV